MIFAEAEQETKARRRPISGRGTERLLLLTREVQNFHLFILWHFIYGNFWFILKAKKKGKKTTTEKKVVGRESNLFSELPRCNFKGGGRIGEEEE